MHGKEIHRSLDAYELVYPGESGTVERIRDLVRNHADCFKRSCLPGHITGSAWIVSADHKRHLLTHHRKLNRWLQVGGHSDGDARPDRIALREAREESGMVQFEFAGTFENNVPFDVDVHTILARNQEPEHEHHDIRYLLIAADGQQVHVSDESHDVRWFTTEEVSVLTDEPSMLRMLGKVERTLTRPRV